jgi:ribonuclease D
MKKLIYNKLDKSLIPDMQRVIFPGKIIVVLSPEEAERSVDYLLSQPVLGLDTETRPAFKKGSRFKCSLLQVATDDCCFLFRLNHMGLCPAIIRLLTDREVTKVGLAWNNDLLSLHELGPFRPGDFIDLQDMCHEVGIEDQSLMKLYANLFHERISKKERLSNWERDILTDSQKQYAAIDAWACVRMYHELQRLKETGDYELVIVPEPEPIQQTMNNDETDSTQER